MEDLDQQAADSIMAGIDFDDVQEYSEAELKALEERYENERSEIQGVMNDINEAIRLSKVKEDTERFKLLQSLLKDDTLILDTIIGNLKEQPQNKVNLKFLLAKNPLLISNFDYKMEDCATFVTLHEPRDQSMYDQSELIHVLKMFVVFVYMHHQKPEQTNNVEGVKEEEIKS